MGGFVKQGVLALSFMLLILFSGYLVENSNNITLAQFPDEIELDIDILTYLGGTDDDRSWSIAVDNEDNIYITGQTNSDDFPATYTIGDNLDSNDIFIAKFSSSGNFIFSTIIGGSSSEVPVGIKVDALGDVYVAGTTYSQDFPIVNGYDPIIEPGNPPYTYGKDGFILKLNSAGNSLNFSTYLGDEESDQISDIAVDSVNNIYVVGTTSSPDFPITSNAFDKNFEHFSEGFVTKLSSNGQSVIYSSFIGGEKTDSCEAIALDSSNNMYITGTTQSAEFPTLNAYSTAFSDDQFCCFVLKLSSGGALMYSTHVGGTSAEFPDGDSGWDIAVDANGNAYVSGETNSEDFPLVNAFVESAAANQDGFILKLGASGNTLVYSSYIGGDYSTTASDLTVNEYGEVCLLGYTSSTEFEAVGGNSTFGGGMSDGLIFLLSATGTPIYSSYFGGSDSDIWGDVALDSTGRILTVGYTQSANLPVESAYDESYNGDSFDAFLVVFSVESITDTSITTATSATATTTTTAITTTTADIAGTPGTLMDVVILGSIGIIAIVAILIFIRKRG